MRLKLIAPARMWYWMITADELQDPGNWSVFLLNHGPGTDRYIFEAAVMQASVEKSVALNSYRLGCKRGLCSLEYYRGSEPAAIRAHAQRVAEILSTNIEMPEDAVAVARTALSDRTSTS